MNALFLSHLIADFLLQPTQLALWKQRHVGGVIVHSAIHGIFLALVLLPKNGATFFIIFAIAALHGIIDQAKIHFHRTHGEKPFAVSFLLDQLAHFAVLFAASFALPGTPDFWRAENFIGSLLLLTFFSFGLALWNLNAQVKTCKLWVSRCLMLAFVFAIFVTSAMLL